jgi:hypothetical protein
MELKGTIDFTDFARRHFDSDFKGTKINIPEDAFLGKLHIRRQSNHRILVEPGYADFCVVITTENFADILTGSMEITNENYHLLRSGYKARTEYELPVLSRWFELPLDPPVAKNISIVLYSKEQIEKEERVRNKDFVFESDWGIVSVMGHNNYQVEPMSPITMMRNALGIEEGGSGVVLNKNDYAKSVEYWSAHAIIQS